MKKIFTFLALAVAVVSLHAQFVDFGINVWKASYAAADIDDDGDMDIVISGDPALGDEGNPEAGAILINDGEGNFTVQDADRVITAGRAGDIEFGDIDGDGDLDIIFAGWGLNNEVKAGIALNDGNGVFTLASADDYPVLEANTITSCGFADFNMDGLLDYYFFANGRENCVIYFQQPDGSFEPVADAIKTTARYNTDTHAVGDPIDYNFVEPEVTVIDFNKDGYPDIWMNAADINCKNEGEQTQRFSYLFANDGFGNLTQFAGAVVPFKKANGTSSWGDINGDGYLDMLLNGDGWLNSGEERDDVWRLFENQSGSALEEAWTEDIGRQGSFGHGSLLVDWNNDGKLDIFGGGWSLRNNNQTTELYLGAEPANFTFTKSDIAFQGASEQALLPVDVNGDNKVDLLVSGFSGAPLARRAAFLIINTSPNASVPPAAPTGLNANYDADEGMVTFSWTAPTSEAGKYGTTYNLSLKNKTTGKWLYNPMAVIGGDKNGWRKVAGKMGNVFTNKSFELYDLPDGEYEWTIQAINGAFFGGAFAEVKTFSVGESSTNEMSDRGLNIFSREGKLIINGPATVGVVNVYGISGNKIASTVLSNQLDVELTQGIYIVEVLRNGYKNFITKVVVQ